MSVQPVENQSDPRHNARKLSLVSLFEWSFHPCRVEEVVPHAEEILELGTEIDKALSTTITTGVIKNIESIDRLVESAATEWPLAQVARIDLTILRMAIYELEFSKDVPPKVAIDEAVKLAKEFGSETSSSFVNGVLGNIIDREEPLPAL